MTAETTRTPAVGALAVALLSALCIAGWDPALVGVAGALVATAAFVSISKSPRPLGVGVIDVAVTAFVVWVLAVTLPRGLPWASTYQVTVFMLLPLAYLAARFDRDHAWGDIWWMLVIGAAGIAAVSLVFYAFGEQPNVFFAVRNNQAAFLNAALFLLVAPPSHGRIPPLLRTALTLLIATAVAVTVSRGALVALVAAAVAVLLVIRPENRAAVLRHLAIVGVGLLVGGLLTAGLLTEKIVGFSEGSFSRWNIYFSAVPVVMEHPWIGHGLGMTDLVWAPHRFAYEGSLGRQLHNDYLQFALEAGIPAAILLAAIPLAAMRAVVTTATPGLRAAAAFGAVAAMSIHCLVDYHLQLAPLLLVFGLVLGALAAEATAPRRVATLRPVRVGIGVVAAVFAAHTCLSAIYSHAMPIADTLDSRLLGGAPMEVVHYREPYDPARARETLDALERAIRVQPHADEPKVLYAGLLIQAGRFDEAAAMLDDALALNPYAYHAHYQYALLHEHKGNAAEAEAHLRRTTWLRPRFLAAHELLVERLVEDGRTDAAYEQTRRALLHARSFHHRQLPFLLSALRQAEARRDLEVSAKVNKLLAGRDPIDLDDSAR